MPAGADAVELNEARCGRLHEGGELAVEAGVRAYGGGPLAQYAQRPETGPAEVVGVLAAVLISATNAVARKAFERAEILMKDQAISRQDYDQRRATLDVADAVLRARKLDILEEALRERILGRTVAADVVNPATQEALYYPGALLGEDEVERIELPGRGKTFFRRVEVRVFTPENDGSLRVMAALLTVMPTNQ